jgi:hypothetical protein
LYGTNSTLTLAITAILIILLYIILYRNPASQARPSFKDILLELHARCSIVLEIPEPDTNSHSLANCVGGPLEAGEKMYTDLQWKYFTSDDYEEQI